MAERQESTPREATEKLSWHLRWLQDMENRGKLMEGMECASVMDQLVSRQIFHDRDDKYQEFKGIKEAEKNKRARLILDHLAQRTVRDFWQFQEALVVTRRADLSVGRNQEDEMKAKYGFINTDASAQLQILDRFLEEKREKLGHQLESGRLISAFYSKFILTQPEKSRLINLREKVIEQTLTGELLDIINKKSEMQKREFVNVLYEECKWLVEDVMSELLIL